MIKTTLVGHACLLIQSKETTILTDPVWFDYQSEEIYEELIMSIITIRVELALI